VGEQERLAARLTRLEPLETTLPKPPVGQSAPAEQQQMAALPEHPCQLAGPQRAVALNDQVEEGVGVGKAATTALLEGDPALGVEADPGDGVVDRLCGAVDATHPRRRVLARQEQHPVAATTADLEDALGVAGNVEHCGGERYQRGRHLADMI